MGVLSLVPIVALGTLVSCESSRSQSTSAGKPSTTLAVPATTTTSTGQGGNTEMPNSATG